MERSWPSPTPEDLRPSGSQRGFKQVAEYLVLRHGGGELARAAERVVMRTAHHSRRRGFSPPSACSHTRLVLACRRNGRRSRYMLTGETIAIAPKGDVRYNRS